MKPFKQFEEKNTIINYFNIIIKNYTTLRTLLRIGIFSLIQFINDLYIFGFEGK